MTCSAKQIEKPKKERMLPYISGRIAIKATDHDVRLVFRKEGGEVFEYDRYDRRWRYKGCGPFVSVHEIASNIFAYEPVPTEQEMHWMGDFVQLVGKVIDSTYEAMSDAFGEWIKDRKRFEAECKNGTFRKFFPDPKPVEVERDDSQELSSYVYLMRHKNGATKIGYSKNPKAREKTLQAEDPELEMIFYASGDMDLERQLHCIFNDLRVRGEWFRLEERHINWIVTLLEHRESWRKPD